MAEILIKAVSATHTDHIRDQRGCYKRGMPVVVMPDGHVWGNAERLPTFFLVKVPGVSPQEVEAYLWPPHHKEHPQCRCSVRFALERLPGDTQKQLELTGEVCINVGGAASTALDVSCDTIHHLFIDNGH